MKNVPLYCTAILHNYNNFQFGVGVVESFGFFKSQQVQTLFLLFFRHFKPIFGEILVDGYLSGMGLSEKINHTHSEWRFFEGRKWLRHC